MKRLYWKIVLVEGVFLAIIMVAAMWIMSLSHDEYEVRRQEDHEVAVAYLKMTLQNELPADVSFESLEKIAGRLFKSDVKIVDSDDLNVLPAQEKINFSRFGKSYTMVVSTSSHHKGERDKGGFFPINDKYIPLLFILTAALGLLAVPLARIVTRPLGELSQDMKLFASGDLAHRTRVASKDEVGNVARDFNSMAESIQTLVRVGKEMTAHVSHELRSPLTRIDVARQVLEEQVSGRQLALLDSMREEIKEMDGLIDRMLRLSRLELNESTPSPLCYAEIVGEAVRRHRTSFEKKGVILQEEIVENLTGTGVAEDIACLVDNLLSNALKFTYSGGETSVTMRQKSGSAVIIVANDAEKPALDPMRLSEPFQRGGVSESVPGSGLGLAIVSRIVENHKGKISLLWKDGRFSAVVELPKDAEI